MKYEVNIIYKGQVNYIVDIPDNQLSEDPEINKDRAEVEAAELFRENLNSSNDVFGVMATKAILGTEYEEIENIVSKEVENG